MRLKDIDGRLSGERDWMEGKSYVMPTSEG